MPNALKDWIYENGGFAETARLLGISDQTPRKWFYHEYVPNLVTMNRIVTLSKGKLTYQSIIDSIKIEAKKYKAEKAKRQKARGEA